MKEKGVISGRKSALVFYIILTVVILLFSMGYYIIASYFPLDYEDIITAHAQDYDLDPNLLCAVIATESRFDADAKSKKGALGLMQIMPDTGEWIAGKLGIEDFQEEMLLDAETNIEIGAWYLSYLLERFDGNVDVAAAAYNAGHGNVDKWLEDQAYSADAQTLDEIPYKETKNYVKKVNIAYEIYSTFYKVG